MYMSNGTRPAKHTSAYGESRKIKSLSVERFFSYWELACVLKHSKNGFVLALAIREDVRLEHIRASLFT